ncbi:MAG: polysaccharide pyruvyl transferase CsaB [Candidatus Eremiobacteraeota bacterium]|nr:polysaccharide pyruvyl transferase CsaB [Candidatus Eremiobacteraeota bacterium]MBC5826763.1 polysaccharide pyruvyl transferase CsaB [Candidatus Eremiobacteraeota bacterium]
MSGRPLRLLLSGYYGFGNFGDEAILRVFIEQWRRRRPHDRLTVLSADPAQTRQRHAVEVVPRSAWGAVRRAIADADVVVSGGGGLLQDATSLRSLAYYAGILREAVRVGRVATIFAQGIGPLSFVGRAIVRRACAGVRVASVRDEESARTLHSLLPAGTVHLGADPVFLCSTNQAADAPAPLDRESLNNLNGPLVAVVVRQAPVLAKLARKLAAGIDYLTREYGAQVIFVPFQRPHDVQAAIEVIRLCRSAPVLLGGDYDLPAMASLFSRCSAVVGMRLHALIVATRLAVPFLPISYDPKIEALTRRLRYPVCDLGHESDGVILVDGLWRQRPALRALLQSASNELERAAASAFDLLQQLAEGTAA